MYAAFAFGMLDMIWKYLGKADLNPGGICDIYLHLPLASVSLAWVPWTIVAFIIGWFVYRNKNVAESAA